MLLFAAEPPSGQSCTGTGARSGQLRGVFPRLLGRKVRKNPGRRRLRWQGMLSRREQSRNPALLPGQSGALPSPAIPSGHGNQENRPVLLPLQFIFAALFGDSTTDRLPAPSHSKKTSTAFKPLELGRGNMLSWRKTLKDVEGIKGFSAEFGGWR